MNFVAVNMQSMLIATKFGERTCELKLAAEPEGTVVELKRARDGAMSCGITGRESTEHIRADLGRRDLLRGADYNSDVTGLQVFSANCPKSYCRYC